MYRIDKSKNKNERLLTKEKPFELSKRRLLTGECMLNSRTEFSAIENNINKKRLAIKLRRFSIC